MRKIIVLSFITLDGVMQAPGGPEEDKSGDFKYGGWSFPYADEFSGKLMSEQISGTFDLLLGRKTYDIFASYWPKPENAGDIATRFNAATKYVASETLTNPTWEKTVVLNKGIVEELKKLKASDGPDLQVHGSGNFIQTLMKNDLVDEMWLKFHPLTLGNGKKLFAEGTIPAAFTLTDSKVTPTGVIFANYKRAPGEIKTGTF
jgi:dihydrofolate reductase